MSIPVIVAYKPKSGMERALDKLIATHVERLRRCDLATGRDSMLMRACDGTVIEVFEWKSKEAIESAHANPDVLKMWAEFDEVCEYTPLSELPETRQLFAEFKEFNTTVT